MPIRLTVHRHFLYFLFAVSGFSGLIYESIWSHYLKLFLGHAAYAQTLVLAIFMGGMAIGAWFASRYSARWKNLLLVYALIEGVIGLLAIAFHGVYIHMTDFAYDTAMPAMHSPWMVSAFKITLSAGLILPQSILLGATFPLMSGGIIRRFPGNTGANLSILYFTNSLGAAIGCLASGFWLINYFGLPGTVLTAGLINMVVALIVWMLARHTEEGPLAESPRIRTGDSAVSWKLLLTAAFFTGTASFIYEIGWIRMLTLVVGSSTHAFELMLSAFIFGLAFGGLWIRRRIDGLKDTIHFLGSVQIIMGLLAVGTLILYNGSFNAMQAVMSAVARTETGYRLFSVFVQWIALAIMAPVTFCAGMTLPLMTHALLSQREGERSIGAIYAANTTGSIVGIFFATHVGLTMLGLKGLIIAGAIVDLVLGIVLLQLASTKARRWTSKTAAALAVTVVTFVVVNVELDRYKMVSGVYRRGNLIPDGSIKHHYHKDGKTSTVDLITFSRHGNTTILNNGKPDASINSTGQLPSPDEWTMTLIAFTALATHPSAKTIANIGLGSGLTAHVLLAHPEVEQVDTIEIEPAVVEAARGFGDRVKNVYTDPRSHIYIDDAKTFFATRNSRYDIIMSEPPNPWVSGVAGLFSDEFYRRTKEHLNPGGLFVQWLQLYEIDMQLVASVFKSIGRNFSDYVIYVANDGDLIIVARPDGTLPAADVRSLSTPSVAKEMNKIFIHTSQDFTLRRLGNRNLIEPLFASYSAPPNSDYFPVLDQNAERTRFMRSGATELSLLGVAPLPILEMLDETHLAPDISFAKHNVQGFSRAHSAYYAMTTRDALRQPEPGANSDTLNSELFRHLAMTLGKCDHTRIKSIWLDSVFFISSNLFSYLPPQDVESLWQRWRAAPCYTQLAPPERRLMELFRAVGQRDAKAMATISDELFKKLDGARNEQGRYLLGAGMLGYLAQQQPADANRLWKTYSERVLGTEGPDLALRLLWAKSIPPATQAQ